MRLKPNITRANLLQHLEQEGFKVNTNSYYERAKGDSNVQLFGNQYAVKVHVSHRTLTPGRHTLPLLPSNYDYERFWFRINMPT